MVANCCFALFAKDFIGIVQLAYAAEQTDNGASTGLDFWSKLKFGCESHWSDRPARACECRRDASTATYRSAKGYGKSIAKKLGAEADWDNLPERRPSEGGPPSNT
eukprot:gnl/TRDRNA2_/TRDRNA2_50978_c0_seq1.p1 gnl/TRDRNA2_/TRDRNA2_50978_c0~~gnl/TRDRNA2_/TRDRNA2_50978_c0_seq1.p1  ORF type:complete len:106 (+),score=10.95 gnl/TRDRNA2_/TRDRNA2_50978_c0_seq1:104-421(+)